jgi:AcrR family transcriptional regulator
MSGLRERQKEERRRAIAAAAITLFGARGYAGTTLEDIANAAGVSVPTIFKYFEGKQSILLEMLAAADRQAILGARLALPDFADPVDALCDLEARLMAESFKVMPPALWRELLPLVLAGGEGDLPVAYRRMNDALKAEIAALLRDLQARGQLGADLDVEGLAFLFNDYSHLQMLRLVQQDRPDMAAHAQEVRRITEIVFRGMAPEGGRNGRR